MKGLLYIVALFSWKICGIILLVWGIVRSSMKRELKQYLFDMAASIDQHGNCSGKYFFNDTCGKWFGDGDETISSVLGKNKKRETLKPFGKFLADTLNRLDKNHVEKAIE